MAGRSSTENPRKPSDLIDLEKLEKETQKLLFIGLIFAFMIHPVVGSYFMFKKNDDMVVQTYSIKFVMRAARLTKPFELKPRHNSQRILDKKTVAVKQPDLDITPKTDMELNIEDRIEDIEIDPELIATAESSIGDKPDQGTVTKESKGTVSQISMKNEMISIEDLDIGQFKAMVVQKPSKHDIRGFVYISTTWGAQLKVPDHLKRSVINLAEAVKRYTNIEAKVGPHLYLDSRELFTIPFVYIITDTAFELTPIERSNFGAYLKAGGFAVVDNGDPVQEKSQAESSLRQMLRDTLGAGIKFAPIPNDHPLYHSFFDFYYGPPQGAEVDLVRTTTTDSQGDLARNSTMSKTVPFLEGIWIGERLAVVYSNKGYGCKWKDLYNNAPQLKMGVNMVVYGLTHEGGIAQKVMRRYSIER